MLPRPTRIDRHDLRRRRALAGLVLVAGAALAWTCRRGQEHSTGTIAGRPIAQWEDSPGECPPGGPKVELRTSRDVENASRGEAERGADPPDTCYWIHDGDYRQGGELLLFVKRGGRPGAPRLFVGQSRAGVVLRGRATVDDGVAHVVLANLTFDLAGYSQEGSFNTITLGRSSDVQLKNLTLTGDCRTGRRGGHVEVNGAENVRINSCVIERFGRCGGEGHEEHGVYLASGRDIEIRDCLIRGNASRGVQLYTAGGEYGTLANIHIEHNRIYDNGHADYEDGIVIAGTGRGTIEDVAIGGNLIYHNYYSGIRFAGGATQRIVVRANTFYENGLRSRRGGRSEINSDGVGAAAGAVIERNIFWPGNRLINDCYDGSAHGFALRDSLLHGRGAPWFKGSCVQEMADVDPDFVDPDAADFRPREPSAAGYGAYAWNE